MKEVVASSRFKRDLKLAGRRGQDLSRVRDLIVLLQRDEPLPARCKDHCLSGNWAHHRECHVAPDWLLIYRLDEQAIYLDRTGSHADLFSRDTWVLLL